MAIVDQYIFKEAFVEKLRFDVINGKGLKSYFKEEFEYPEDAVWPTGLKVVDGQLNLIVLKEGNQADLDLQNAIQLYESFNINETQASDARLWVYLSHCTFRKYVMARWKLINISEDGKADNNALKELILSHWFVGGNDRSLRRNAISRLWWAVHLTISPWEKDPVFYQGANLSTSDQYFFTRILFSTQDVYQQVLERSLGRDSHILIPLLSYLNEHGPFTRDQIRKMVKELNIILSIRNISMMNFVEIKEFLKEIGASIFQNGE